MSDDLDECISEFELRNEVRRLRYEIAGHLKAWDSEHAEVERLRYTIDLAEQDRNQLQTEIDRLRATLNAVGTPVFRNNIIEECALLLEGKTWRSDEVPTVLVALAAIRALKDKP